MEPLARQVIEKIRRAIATIESHPPGAGGLASPGLQR
jgi:hypothetical protein